jgi:hypothetical protein
MFLPKISEDTLNSTFASLRDDSGYAKKTITQIKEENPTLYSLITTMVDSSKDIEFIKGYIVGASQFYSLLDRQTESNILDELYE